jgi:hypothetical protein
MTTSRSCALDRSVAMRSTVRFLVGNLGPTPGAASSQARDRHLDGRRELGPPRPASPWTRARGDVLPIHPCQRSARSLRQLLGDARVARGRVPPTLHDEEDAGRPPPGDGYRRRRRLVGRLVALAHRSSRHRLGMGWRLARRFAFVGRLEGDPLLRVFRCASRS